MQITIIATGFDKNNKTAPGNAVKVVKEEPKVTEISFNKVNTYNGNFTDVADTEQLLRIIQSIPSPKAEPFKKRREKSRVATQGRGHHEDAHFIRYSASLTNHS